MRLKPRRPHEPKWFVLDDLDYEDDYRVWAYKTPEDDSEYIFVMGETRPNGERYEIMDIAAEEYSFEVARLPRGFRAQFDPGLISISDDALYTLVPTLTQALVPQPRDDVMNLRSLRHLSTRNQPIVQLLMQYLSTPLPNNAPVRILHLPVEDPEAEAAAMQRLCDLGIPYEDLTPPSKQIPDQILFEAEYQHQGHTYEILTRHHRDRISGEIYRIDTMLMLLPDF
jgi:hypothetical protein